MTTQDTTTGGAAAPSGRILAETHWRRLVFSQTAVDFWGRRRIYLTVSAVLLVISILSLSFRGLLLGIDFAGGVAWDVPAGQLTTDEAENVLEQNGLSATAAKIQERASDSGDIIKIQVVDQPDEVRRRLRGVCASAAGLQPNEESGVSVSA